MPLDKNDGAKGPRSAIKRRRGVLLATVCAIGLTGLVAGEALLVSPTPANAQIHQTQNLSEQGKLDQRAPQQQAQLSFADIVETVKPAVVSVRVKIEDRQTSSGIQGQMPGFFRDLPPDHPLRRFFDDFGVNPGQQGEQAPGPRRGPGGQQPRRFGAAQGSGFFISADGYVVTNNHVIENASEVELVTDSGDTVSAKVIGSDPRTDLALLKVDGRKDFPFVSFADSELPRVGDWVVAIGNPFGLGGSVTAGIVSARGRDIGAGPYDDFLQIDAAVNRGNSGGPTFNLRGEVVGVNTAIYSPSGGNVGIAFAVPSEVARNVIDELRENGSVTRGWLGVQIQPVTDEIAQAIGLEEARGAMVVEPQPDSPGAKAGIQAGDVVLSVNGSDVADARDLSRSIAGLKPGTDAKLQIWRDGDEREISVELGTLPEEPRQANAGDGPQPEENSGEPTKLSELGLTLAPASSVEGSGEEGVVVMNVEGSDGVAERLSTGDIILEAGGEKVSTPNQVRDAVAAARERGTRSLLLRIRSGEATRYVAVPVGRG